MDGKMFFDLLDKIMESIPGVMETTGCETMEGGYNYYITMDSTEENVDFIHNAYFFNKDFNLERTNIEKYYYKDEE